jgi:hypothetical protein
MPAQPHLRPVVSPADSGGTDGGSKEAGKSRAPQVQSAALPLPTDRLVMDLQLKILQTIARLSGGRKAPIPPADVAKSAGDTAASSVVLVSRFYVATGLVDKDAEGRYTASDALVEYSRRLTTHGAEYAMQALHEPAKRAWFWAVLAPGLAEGPMKMGDAKILLMREAKAGDSHVNKVTNLLTWLRMIGLITINGDEITLADSPAVSANDAPEHDEPEPENMAEKPTSGASGAPVQESNKNREDNPPATVLAVSFDVRVTADDLARLSPDQIKALFEAVGTVMAHGGAKG